MSVMPNNDQQKQNLDTKTSQENGQLSDTHETAVIKAPSGGNRKVPKNCWKKVNIDLEYNTSREISRRRQLAWRGERRGGETYGRRDQPKEQRKGSGRGAEESSARKDEAAEKSDKKETAGEAEDGRAEGGGDEATARKRTTAPTRDTKTKNGPNEDGAETGTDQQQQQSRDYWYFDEMSNGYYYQHSGSQGWKKTGTDQPQQQPRDYCAGPRMTRMPYRSGGGGGIGGPRRSGGGTDYWHKKGGGGGGGQSGGGREDDRERRTGGSYYEQRNDRWQRNHHPNAPPPLSVAQRRARGPLPDWDEVQEVAADSFDYMEIMESQYSQYYALSAVPPFDPSLGVIASVAHPSTPIISSIAVTAAHANVVSASTVPPASLLSPNGLISFPLTSPTALPPNAIVVATSDQFPSSTGATQFTPVVLTAQFPSNALFATRPPTTAPFMDEQKLKDIVRSQIEYYFSADNLQKDFFLRRKMDIEGFLPLGLVATFPRVRSLTLDQNFIVSSLCDSDNVELSEDHRKVRPRLNPQQWPLVESATDTEAQNSPTTASGAVEEIAVDNEEMEQKEEQHEEKEGAEEGKELERPQSNEQQRQPQPNSSEEMETTIGTSEEEQRQSETVEEIMEEPKQQQKQEQKGEDQEGWKEVRTKRGNRKKQQPNNKQNKGKENSTHQPQVMPVGWVQSTK
ncbi:hypothetical protein niasHT_008078 [Heterodera trifolii]|uniref:HTH La-type RNA-binding domain-containing protein n=1 Tax=Heterodera trifolii TaxID=157864 RepID=A0ABD2LZY8_9BILA